MAEKEMASADACVLLTLPNQSDTAIVAFSSRHAKKFDYYRVLEPFSASKLLVRDPSDSWYNAGLPEVGNTVNQIADRLRAELEKMGVKQTIVVGSSMGAYAAVLFGCLIRAEQVLAFSPQTLLDPSLPYCPPSDVPLQAANLAPLIRASPQTKLEIMVGWDDLLDVFYVLRIAHLPSVRILAMLGGAHTFVETLGRKGLVGQVIKELIDGRVPGPFEVQTQIDPEIREGVTDAVLAFHRSDYTLVIERLTPIVEAHPDWAGPQFLLGRACFNASDTEGAEAAFSAANRANPEWYEPYGHLGRTLVQLQHPTKAEPLLRRAAEMKPDWAWNHLFIGECLIDQGRTNEAKSSFDIAVKLDPSFSETVQALTG